MEPLGTPDKIRITTTTNNNSNNTMLSIDG